MTGPFFRPFPRLMLEPGHYSPSFLANVGCVRKATLAICISIRGDLAAPMATMQDSRVILDRNGAEDLTPPGQAILVRG